MKKFEMSQFFSFSIICFYEILIAILFGSVLFTEYHKNILKEHTTLWFLEKKSKQTRKEKLFLELV